MSQIKSIDEFMDELNSNRNVATRIEDGYFIIKYKIKSLTRLFKVPVWWYQRITRGYSDRDMWSADYFLAGQIAGTLTWLVEKGHGVATSYGTPPNYEDDIDDMVARRDAEYLHYASIFAEYAKNGPALNLKWQEELGGILDKDMQEALQWLSEHFTELWD